MKRFSLRSLLIMTAVIAIVFALPVRRALTQKRGRDWVASQRGYVTFSHEFDSIHGEHDHDATLGVPEWMVRVLGVDFFDSVDTVVLDNTMLKDLKPITDLRDLRSLAIIIEIDDNLSFEPLTELPKLRHLHLDYTDISAERLAALREMLPNVRVDAMNHPPPEQTDK